MTFGRMYNDARLFVDDHEIIILKHDVERDVFRREVAVLIRERDADFIAGIDFVPSFCGSTVPHSEFFPLDPVSQAR